MHARKTGALIRASVAAGAVMGGADDTLFAALDQYGTEIGLAFQIVDDILDEEGSAASLGKTAGKDRAAGKPTYPGVLRPRPIARARRRMPQPRAVRRSSAPACSIPASPTSRAGSLTGRPRGLEAKVLRP